MTTFAACGHAVIFALAVPRRAGPPAHGKLEPCEHLWPSVPGATVVGFDVNDVSVVRRLFDRAIASAIAVTEHEDSTGTTRARLRVRELAQVAPILLRGRCRHHTEHKPNAAVGLTQREYSMPHFRVGQTGSRAELFPGSVPAVHQLQSKTARARSAHSARALSRVCSAR